MSSNPLVQAILGGSAPRALKLTAARAVLPLPRPELIQVLVFLLADADAAVSREAGTSLTSIDEEDLLTALSDPGTPRQVLEHFGSAAPSGSAIRGAILTNPATPEMTLLELAPKLVPQEIDELLLLQTRLIESPHLLDQLALNPRSTALQKARFEEIKKHFLEKADTVAGVPAAEPGITLPVEPPAAPPPEPSAEVRDDASEPTPSTLEEFEAAGQKIMRMTTSEKVKFAFKANREERGILIKDTSRMVQSAVLDSPMLTEHEVEMFAKNRTLSEEVLRIISKNRTWMKKYVIIHALATNPKTPSSIAMTLISRLTPRDLKMVVSDKNLPEAIRRQSRRVIEMRNKRQAGR